MTNDASVKYIVPRPMAECVSAAYMEIFGTPLVESIFLESQREIDEMTRRAVYRSIVTNIVRRVPNWDDPQIQRLYQQVHDDHMKPVSQFLDTLQQAPHMQGIQLPEYDTNTFTNRRGHELTLMQSILNNIRQTFFNFAGANTDYMPGATRIAILLPGLGGCGFGSPMTDQGEVKLLKAFIKYACEVCPEPDDENAEFSVDFNGMTLRDIRNRYGNALHAGIEERRAAVRGYNAANAGGDYRIVHIPDFATATRYRQYLPVSPWCITTSQMMWDSYTLEGANTVYFCMKDGFENIRPEPGENAPLDEYGTSMIAVIVDSDGDLCTATPRWNDANGSSDYLLTEENVVDLIGRPFYEAFPPVESEQPDYLRNLPHAGRPPMGGRMLPGNPRF